MKLSDLKVGETARVQSIDITDREIKRHLMDMGIVKDTIVKITKVPPMKDPVCIELRDYELAVRRIDIEKIECEVLEK